MVEEEEEEEVFVIVIIIMIIVLLVTAITSLLVLGVLIYTIRKYMGSTTVDVGHFDFPSWKGNERGYRGAAQEVSREEGRISDREEKRGIGTNELSISETKTIVPILTKSEMEADTVVTMVSQSN